MSYKPINYHDYLKLDQILSSQTPRSAEDGRPAHDEMLFIVVHQAYELWFKQILHEVDSILSCFNQPTVDEQDMGTAVSRLHRVIEIQRLLFEQVSIIETMTPLDFLDFRDLLYPASGFQSAQFRVLENKLGLMPNQRLSYNNTRYTEHLRPDQQQGISELEEQSSLFDCIERWLERTPFLEIGQFDFWGRYREAVGSMFQQERDALKQNPFLSDEDKKRGVASIEQSEGKFAALFDEKLYEQQRQQGTWRLSHKATRAALLIQLYRHQPIFQIPFSLITALQDIDENMTSWRYRHALMARRMLGAKIGTGGSSGSDYLQATAERHKVFSDFFQLTTFFIPKSKLPELPKDVKAQLGFYYNSHLPQE
ncbi:MAG: tryptophan 2,3-dioxygenase [Pseudobdellovibrionaceae bacterium]|nr:tryptophan 2,3-dioxygenase [Bdellovibrionales bacterium]USN48117.1 MAG: tryptophan 2,3-dioxygenase [Pseudobdellovibrionaceae bacterium]